MNGSNGALNYLSFLDDKNWNRWTKQMKSLFGFYKILELVNNDILELADNATDA